MMDRALALALLLAASSRALAPTRRVVRRVATRTYASDADDLLAEAERLRREAAALEATLPKREPVGRPEFVDEAPSYDGATIVVTGANGRLGSAVASELLERGASVRCIIRSSEPEAYGRLSYEVGAESLVGTIEAPWILRDTSQGGPLFDSPATYAAPEDDSLADTSAADYAAMTPFGQNQVVAARAARRLRRLEMRVADLRDPGAVAAALAGADSVVYCASSYEGTSETVATDGADALLREAGRLFELRLPRLDKVKEARASDDAAGSADVEGVESAAAALEVVLRRSPPRPNRPLAFLLVSATAGFDAKYPPFAKRKREAEAALRDVAVDADWAGAVALRLPPLDDFKPRAPGSVVPAGPPARLRPANRRDVADAVCDALLDPELRSPRDFQAADYVVPAPPE